MKLRWVFAVVAAIVMLAGYAELGLGARAIPNCANDKTQSGCPSKPKATAAVAGQPAREQEVVGIAPQADPAAIVAPIASNFNTTAELVPSWGNGAIPVSAAPDNVGAFRFACAAGISKSDDPIVWYGQPGKSHLHTFFGNTKVNAGSTYASLRATGDSTCMSKLNRSAYWQPAMLDGDGRVVNPTFGIYYKRYPASSPLCKIQGDECVAIPPGLKFIFGYDMLTGKPATGSTFWQCTTQKGDVVINERSQTMKAALRGCAVGMRLEVRIEAPDCWDGERLDSANHRDHVAYAKYNDRGQLKCDRKHPKVMPQYTQTAFWTVTADASKWVLSSDAMMGAEPGGTYHADFFSAWDPATEAKWIANCIDKLLNCSGGDLGNGQQLRGTATVRS
ncbi:DUF1996 domain-containing protein [Sphingomonas panacisoli]|uniref:DUF1996 domain-containing protein n=1 Tax=Sphingomonas panacisoli TaxID=1813879 RepID=A0A5B8LJR9_9SPHN|nr:DUF1996 domain-containing protein [Sphingomonas panacisoli]QDZ08537.1 DUF1996 domain-containing protein [Sphingomonas panacisoli]